MLLPDEGQVVLGGKDVSHARKREWTALRRELLVMVITIAVPHASTEGVTAYGITVEILPVLAGGVRASPVASVPPDVVPPVVAYIPNDKMTHNKVRKHFGYTDEK